MRFDRADEAPYYLRTGEENPAWDTFTTDWLTLDELPPSRSLLRAGLAVRRAAASAPGLTALSQSAPAGDPDTSAGTTPTEES